MLTARCTPGAEADRNSMGWRLQIPAGERGRYRLAQLDDYTLLRRQDFPNSKQAYLTLTCRASSRDIPGTWGFGFWNDPFAFSMGMQGTAARLPALPNACWYFHASPENHLSFLPARAGNGFLAQNFSSPRIPSSFLLPGALALPLLTIRPVSRWLRAAAGKLIGEDSQRLQIDVTQWHTYELEWSTKKTCFLVDQKIVFETIICPRGPLGIVIWIDNQMAAWLPDGTIKTGTLMQTESSWIEIRQLEIKS